MRTAPTKTPTRQDRALPALPALAEVRTERARRSLSVFIQQAIMRDPTAPAAIKVKARRAATGRLANPAKRRFWTQHAGPLTRFYSDLPAEMAEELAG